MPEICGSMKTTTKMGGKLLRVVFDPCIYHVHQNYREGPGPKGAKARLPIGDADI